MCKKLLTIMVFMCLLSTQAIWAQDKTITGTVIGAADGTPLPGVTVMVKGTSTGTSTDFDGNYSLSVPSEGILVFSYVGFTTQEVNISGKTVINVTLTEDTQQLDEVVVTALGIKRERKSIGYAMQEVGGAELKETSELNVANALSGKVAGVQIVKGSNGPASSSKIILRGNNSLIGDNQPLIVVDGIPMDNFTGADNNDFFNPSQDMGNGLGDLNSDDIESLSVLKGASAAALYGSRAGNGVILITTKSGKATKGLGITFSATTGFQSVFTKPELQSSYAQGAGGSFEPRSSSSWGPKIEGQTVEDWNGDQVVLRPYDNISNYYNSGFNQTYNLSFQQQVSDGTSLYTSASYLNDDSYVVGANLERLNLTTRAISKFGENKKWTTDVKVQYINSKAENRPINGSNISNPYGTIAALPRTLNIRDFSNPIDESGNMRWYLESNSLNPYWGARYNLSEDSRDRFLLNGSIKHEFTDWLRAEIKAGADLYTTNTESKVYAGSPLVNNGRYSLGKNTFIEKNFSTLITASRDNLLGKFGGSITLGGNLMSSEASGISSSSGEFVVPNYFSLNNGVNPATVSQSFIARKINSLYGTVQLNYDGYLFVDVTGRNDWSSTLSKANRSFFYPSVSTSLVFTDMLKRQDVELPGWLTFGKVRASYASVGNDLDPYQLINSYSIGNDPNGNTTASSDNVLYNPDVRSELIKSYEVGFEGRFFNNRVGLDFAWYKSNATNQLINIQLDPMSGYNSRKVNAGDVQNKGIELLLTADIFENSEGFSWTTSVNYSKNENTIVELLDDVSQYRLGGFDNLAVLAIAGGGYGEIWGTKFKRVEDQASPNYGKIIVDEQGLPQAVENDEKFKLGDQQADALLGFSNTFSYKNFSFSFLIDARFGGEIYSGTNHALQEAGVAGVTVIDGERSDIVFDGVVADGNGGYAANSTAVTPEVYWSAITGRSGNLGITEANIYDASNIRLRNVSLNYVLPKKWLQNSPIQTAKFGISANNVWMIKSHLKGVDPESVFATGSNATGFEYLSSPTSRSVFFNVSLSF